ncbi:hypothetical protein BBK36DRAFT_1204724 [Trichoderma citrinoviride]|uniref:Uncharacterized protein n=1 Tax=Trichoderma citrinoviride TaxID=58853 RepID=A0A2T4B7J7_9HYPO|nr:hypothetical protein BBK36DRAFT_1204724 [Trichoderma citrinoviride]PTB65280.1 hypothetical protein BBK36DRAFT_1204724 [Trichoderma citrinoviride]
MAIRERFRRALRRSDDSDTISQTDSNATTASSARQSSSSESAPQLSLKKTSSTLSRTLASLGIRDKEKDKDKEAAKREEKDRRRNRGRTYKHPSEKPLTEQNLKHQEMLSHFKMEFGASDPSQVLQDLDFDGISPCCTRVNSLDLGPEDV